MKNFITGLIIFSGVLLLQAGCLTESVGNLVESTSDLMEGVGDLVESAVELVKSANDLVKSTDDNFDLVWLDWTKEDWKNLTPEDINKFSPTPEALITPDKLGFNPLLYASAYSSVATIQRLIYYGANVHQKFANGWTALGSAIIAENNDVVTVLIEEGVDINQQFGEDWVPLVAGIARENAAAVASLLAAGADQDVLQQFDFLKSVNIPPNSADYLSIADSLIEAWKVAETNSTLPLMPVSN